MTHCKTLSNRENLDKKSKLVSVTCSTVGVSRKSVALNFEKRKKLALLTKIIV